MKKTVHFSVIMALLLLSLLTAAPIKANTTVNYGDVTLNGGSDTGHFDDVWDLTAGDIVLSFTYDANGLVDLYGWEDHAWAELGVRSLTSASDFNPYWRYGITAVDLVAGKNQIVGTVLVWSSGVTIYVSFEVTEPDCYITEAHVAIAEDLNGIPQKNGNPIPGQFPYKTPITDWTFAIDATQFSTSKPLYIAAHAVVVCPCGKTETAWGSGCDFPGKNWGMYFSYNTDKTAGSGVWLATDHDEWQSGTLWPNPNTFASDEESGAPYYPIQDMDDKLILQRRGGYGEGDYNLPSTPPAPGNNHRVWWDRDGVDPWQNPETANTGGIYQIEIHLHATSITEGTAYMNIRGLDQGFEVDGNWNTIELTPAGMTFTGDMKHLQVFYGLYGYGATHSVTFSDITVTQPPP